MYLFLLLTRPGSTTSSAVDPLGQQAHPHRRRASGRPGGGVTAASDVPPHAFSKQGELSGVVYTISLSRLEPDAVIPAWPPATSGPDALAKKWKAVVSQGTLVLTPVVDPQQAQQQQQAAGKKQAAARKEASSGEAAGASEEGGAAEGGAAVSSSGEVGSGEAPPAAAPAKVGIPLENCTGEEGALFAACGGACAGGMDRGAGREEAEGSIAWSRRQEYACPCQSCQGGHASECSARGWCACPAVTASSQSSCHILDSVAAG